MFPTEDFEVDIDFGCSFADVLCKSQENTAEGMSWFIGWMAENLLGAQSFNPESSLWGNALEEAGYWWGFALLVMFITAIVGLSIAAVRGDAKGIQRTLIGTALSIPATMFSIFIVGEGLRIADQISDGLLERVGGKNGLSAVMETLFRTESAVGSAAAIAASGFQSVTVLLVLIIFALGVLMIMIALAFRNFLLLILIAFAPLGFMILPHKGGDVWMKRWFSAVVAMVLAKPLIFGVLALLTKAFGEGDTLMSPESLTLGIGLILAAFMPLMAFSFFGFIVGSGAQTAGDSVGSSAASNMKGSAMSGAQMGRGLPRMGGGASAGVGGAGKGAAGGAAVGAAGAAGSPATSAAKAGAQGTDGAAQRPGAGSGAQPRWGSSGQPVTPSGPSPQRGANIPHTPEPTNGSGKGE